MKSTTVYSFTRYLRAKKSVDDRALNARVWAHMAEVLPAGTLVKPLRLLEAGAGIGTMVTRLVDQKVFSFAEYTAVDARTENITFAKKYLTEWAKDRNYEADVDRQGKLDIYSQGTKYRLSLENQDIFTYLSLPDVQKDWDLLIAHAFLDLVDLQTALPVLLQAIKPGGIFYFTINFDGLTVLEPPLDADFDTHILNLYHLTMDNRQPGTMPGGASRTGRQLFAALRSRGAAILAAGSSDWLVYPGQHGYPEDEAYFLHYIIHTIHTALAGHRELDSDRFSKWVATRHAQIEQGELVYLAHQIDVLGRAPATGAGTVSLSRATGLTFSSPVSPLLR